MIVEERVTFESDGLTLCGILRLPDGLTPGERRPAFLALHGFGIHKGGQGAAVPADFLTKAGYVTLCFDFRGCGESEGEPARILCLDQVSDTRNALSYLASRPEVEPNGIALVGTSFGGAVACYTGGVDERVAGVISSGGWGNGERKFRGQHPSAEAWDAFTSMLERGRRHREETGESLMVPRNEIVPIPPSMEGFIPAGAVDAFPAETAQSMFDFRADDVVGGLAPRPLLLLHAANDSVTPTEQSVSLFQHAGQPADLHLLSQVDHFMWSEDNPTVWAIVRNWLERRFPLRA